MINPGIKCMINILIGQHESHHQQIADGINLFIFDPG